MVSIADFGLFIELDSGVEGLIHASEIKKKPDEKIDELFKIGTILTSRIINVNPSERKIDLSMKTMMG